jgi:hypothetical protein
MGNINQAMTLYERVHSLFPEDQESLQYLIMISKDLGVNHERYDVALRKLQRLEEAKAAHAQQQGEDPGARGEGEGFQGFPGFPVEAGFPGQPPAGDFGELPVVYGVSSEDYSDSKENIAFEKPKKMMLAKKQKSDADDLDWGDTSDLLLP